MSSKAGKFHPAHSCYHMKLDFQLYYEGLEVLRDFGGGTRVRYYESYDCNTERYEHYRVFRDLKRSCEKGMVKDCVAFR